jgi:cytoskeletal protein RodZ
MRKALWIWVIVAFVVGLAPGAAAAWWLRRTSVATRQQLIATNTTLRSQNRALQTKLDAAEASVTALSDQIAQAQAGPSATTVQTSTSTTAGPTGEPTIVGRAVKPLVVTHGGKLVLSVVVTGHADKVNMRVVGRGGAFDKTYFLGKASVESTGATWEKTIEAPETPGNYNYYAIAYSGGKKYTMPGVAEFVFQVK